MNESEFPLCLICQSTVYSVEKSLDFNYALVLHGWQYLLLVILGVFSLWKESLSYGDLGRVEMKVEAGG